MDVFRHKGLSRKRGHETAIRALLTSGPEIILRRSRVEKALKPLGMGMDDWTAVTLFEDGAPLDEDFVLLEPRTVWPMDRDASEAAWSHPENPHGSLHRSVTRLEWAPERRPGADVFRVAEQQSIIMARQDMAEALSAAFKGLVFAEEAPYRLQDPKSHMPPDAGAQLLWQGPEAGNWSDPLFAARQPATQARASADAFWRIAAGRAKDGDREQVCANPHYALWLALCVEREAFDDTAAAVLNHPLRVFQYAAWIDGEARDDTRISASRDPRCAFDYARYVDHGPHPVTRAAVEGTKWLPDYERWVPEAARAWGRMQGHGARADSSG